MEARQIYDAFLKVEAEQNFFDININGINIWNNVRIYIYSLTLEKEGWGKASTMSDIMVQHKKNSPLTILKQLLDVGGIEEVIKYLPFFPEKRDLLCVLFPVRRKNGKYDEEIYVDKYYSQIKNHTYYALEWATEIGTRSSNPQTQNLRYTCDDVILSWFGKREHIDYKNIYRQFYTLILKKLESELGIRFTDEERKKVYREIYINYYKRNAYMSYYRFILKQIRPKVILYYNIAEYYTQFLVEAARMLNIKTAEIQHGIFAQEAALPYIYMPEQRIPVVSDYMLIYGEYFNELLNPKRLKTICIGRPDIFQKNNQYKKKHRNQDEKKKLLFVSSCDGVVEYLYQIWKEINFEKYDVILKLHPSEQLNWRKTYPFLSELENIKIVSKNDKDIYYWISRADYMIGNYSTAFYEALPNSIVKIFLDDGTSLIQYLVEAGYCLCVKRGKTVMDVIEQVEKKEVLLNKFENDDYIMYSKPIDRMDNVLEEIITSEKG